MLDNSAWSPVVPTSNSAWETCLLEVTRRRWMLKVSTLPAYCWRDWCGILLVFYHAWTRKMLTERWRLDEDKKDQPPPPVYFSHLSMMVRLSGLSWAVCQPPYPQYNRDPVMEACRKLCFSNSHISSCQRETQTMCFSFKLFFSNPSRIKDALRFTSRYKGLPALGDGVAVWWLEP